MINVKAIDFDETRFYNIDKGDTQYIKSIHSVYAFDPDEVVRACELTPSYDLCYLYTYIIGTDAMGDHVKDTLNEKYCYLENSDMYMHCSDVNKLHSKDCGTFEDMESACESLISNWPI